jgi:hypothetical protein
MACYRDSFTFLLVLACIPCAECVLYCLCRFMCDLFERCVLFCVVCVVPCVVCYCSTTAPRKPSFAIQFNENEYNNHQSHEKKLHVDLFTNLETLSVPFTHLTDLALHGRHSLCLYLTEEQTEQNFRMCTKCATRNELIV